MEFTSSKVEQPLRGMELQEKEEKEERHKRKLIRSNPKKVPIKSIHEGYLRCKIIFCNKVALDV